MTAMVAPKHRGLLLDVCRHFMPAEDVKRLLRAAANCGVNRLHWHLADDQGWRVESKKYPRLTEVGSRRDPAWPKERHENGFYTQEEIRELVAFAQDLGIGVIPEIEIPGHASALLAAYPEYSCRRAIARGGREEIAERGYRPRVVNYSGIFPNLICAGRDEALQFLRDILDEMAGLFPFPAFHLGGDEALKQHWRRCPDCQARIRAEGLRDEEELQRWLMLKVGEHLAKMGKDVIVYNDALNGGPLPKHFIVQHWQGNEREVRAFLEGGGRAICSDLELCYFDYPYSAIDVGKLREAPRIPKWCQGYEDGLLGYECMLWTEWVEDLERAACLLFPRLPAAMLRFSGDPCCESPEALWAKLRELRADSRMLGAHWAPEPLWQMTDAEAREDAKREEKYRAEKTAGAAQREERGLIRLEALEGLMKKIGMPRIMALSAADTAAKGLIAYEGTPESDALPGAQELARQLLEALDNREKGPWKGLPEEVFLDTLKCFSRFVAEHLQEHGCWGFDRGAWTASRQVQARLFRLGTLEYELRERADGAPFIDLHIPSDASLEAEALNASLQRAGAFLQEHFPAWAGAPMECDTWLLAPALEDLLPEDSRIRAFRRAFRIVKADPDQTEYLQWLFRVPAEAQKSVDFSALPEETRLQRSVKQALLEGRRIGSARGVLIEDFS